MRHAYLFRGGIRRGTASSALLSGLGLLLCMPGCGESQGTAGDESQPSVELAIPAELTSEPTPERVDELVEIGRGAFIQKGCISCHMVTGEPLTGPGLSGIYGQSLTLVDGSVIDRDLVYLYKSIVVPNEYKSQAGGLVMPAYAFLDEQTLVGLAYFVRSLSDTSPSADGQEDSVSDE